MRKAGGGAEAPLVNVPRIELGPLAWKASILPLNYTSCFFRGGESGKTRTSFLHLASANNTHIRHSHYYSRQVIYKGCSSSLLTFLVYPFSLRPHFRPYRRPYRRPHSHSHCPHSRCRCLELHPGPQRPAGRLHAPCVPQAGRSLRGAA